MQDVPHKKQKLQRQTLWRQQHNKGDKIMKKLLFILFLLFPSVALGYTEHEINKVSDNKYTSLTKQAKRSLPMLDRTHNLCYVVFTREGGVWQKPIYRGPWFLFTTAEYEKVMENVQQVKKLSETYGDNLFMTYWANYLEASICLF